MGERDDFLVVDWGGRKVYGESGIVSGNMQGGLPGAVIGGLKGFMQDFGKDIFGEGAAEGIVAGLDKAMGGMKTGTMAAGLMKSPLLARSTRALTA